LTPGFAAVDALVGCANRLGLLTAEIDAADGELLGNSPRAVSHVGLIKAGWEIDRARVEAERAPNDRDHVAQGRFGPARVRWR
jgi:hypothetical protein